MELRATFQIPTLIKALSDIVLPAVDPNNKLAQEQAQLIIGSLHLIAQRLPLQYRYDRHELASFLALADQLREEADAAPELETAMAALAASASTGKELLGRAGTEPGELEAMNLAIRAAVGRFVQVASTMHDDRRRGAIESIVITHAGTMLLRERAWLALQGWEGKNPGLPAIEPLIGD